MEKAPSHDQGQDDNSKKELLLGNIMVNYACMKKDYEDCGEAAQGTRYCHSMSVASSNVSAV